MFPKFQIFYIFLKMHFFRFHSGFLNYLNPDQEIYSHVYLNTQNTMRHAHYTPGFAADVTKEAVSMDAV